MPSRSTALLVVPLVYAVLAVCWCAVGTKVIRAGLLCVTKARTVVGVEPRKAIIDGAVWRHRLGLRMREVRNDMETCLDLGLKWETSAWEDLATDACEDQRTHGYERLGMPAII